MLSLPRVKQNLQVAVSVLFICLSNMLPVIMWDDFPTYALTCVRFVAHINHTLCC